MAVQSATKTIRIDPDSEFARLLKRAAEESALLDVDGTRFRVESEEPDPSANHDPERVRAAIKRMTGAWKGIDAEALIAELRAQRDQDSTGRPAQ